MHALVIDDSKPVRSILTKVLNSLQFQCIEAQNGVEALDRLSHMPRPTLITLNRHMPEMDGFELTEESIGAKAAIHPNPGLDADLV